MELSVTRPCLPRYLVKIALLWHLRFSCSFSSLFPYSSFRVCTWSNTRGHIVRDISHHFVFYSSSRSPFFPTFFLHEKKIISFFPPVPIPVFDMLGYKERGFGSRLGSFFFFQRSGFCSFSRLEHKTKTQRMEKIPRHSRISFLYIG